METTFGFVGSRALSTAVELELFTHVHQGGTTVPELARWCQASERGTQMLVEALAALGFLTYDKGQIGLAPDSELFLVKTAPGYMGTMTLHLDKVANSWNQLTEIVKTGVLPRFAIESDHDDGKFFAGFVDAGFAMSWPAAQLVAKTLGEANDVLDIGAGSGVWGLGFATAYPQCKLVEVDRQAVVDKVSRPFAQRMGVADRVSFKTGNFREVDLGQECFDVALLGHILHSEGMVRSKALLRRIFQALRPGGTLMVAEMITDDNRNQDAFALRFGLNMLVLTEEGCVFTRSELAAMAHEAGFSQVDWLEAPAPYPLALFRKA